MNRKGDIPTLMLFVMALILSAAALFSFVSFNDTFSRGSEGRSEIVGDVLFYQGYIVKMSEVFGKEAIRELVGEKSGSLIVGGGCCAEVDSQGRSSCREAESAVECTLVGNFNPIDNCSDSVCEFVGFNAFVDEEKLKKKFQELAAEGNLGIKGIESYFGKIGRGEFDFRLTDYGSRYEFIMNDIFVYSSRGANKIERGFSFRVVFDLKGEVFSREVL